MAFSLDEIDNYPKFNLRGSIGPKVSDGILEMFGGTENVSPSDLRDFIDENKDADVLVIEISTPGGYVNEAFEMFDMLKASGKEIVTIGYRVNSAGTLIMLAGDEGKRFAAENAECVIHCAAIPPEALFGGARLTSDELDRLARAGEEQDKKILSHYTKVLGKDKEQSLLAAMKVETNIGAKGMVKYGFANKTYKPKKKVNLDNVKTRAFSITPEFVNIIESKIQNPDTMSQDVKKLSEKVDLFINRFEAGLTKLFKASKAFKADVTLTADNGASIVVATEDDTIEGKPATIDGAPAPEGDHNVTDPSGAKKVITVDASGVITAVKDAAPAEDAEAKKQIETLTASLKAEQDKNKKLESDLVQAKAEASEAAKGLKELKADFQNFKAEVTGDPEKKDKDLKIDEQKWAAMTPSQRVFEQRRLERQAAAK